MFVKNKNVAEDIFNLFNCVLVESSDRINDDNKVNMDNIEDGFVTNFDPTKKERNFLRKMCKPLDVITLFSKKERENAEYGQLVAKQILHYIEVYGLDQPGLFNLEVKKGKVCVLRNIKAITMDELQEKIRNILYSNRPGKNIENILNIITELGITYDFNRIKNNELRIAVFDEESSDVFPTGDDAVRYICYRASGRKSTLLIKNREMIELVQKNTPSDNFLANHTDKLANVFNRHKKLIMACKNTWNSNIINRISRKSKKLHIPIKMLLSKNLVSLYMKGEVGVLRGLDGINLREKMKILNYIEWKLEKYTIDLFVIRNGKVFTKDNRPVYKKRKLKELRTSLLLSIANNLRHLENKEILLDPAIDYGLPISEKQTIGRLPFGTEVTVKNKKKKDLSFGIYWRNEWGATDLDLSAVDESNHRIGWGGSAGFNDKNVIFSGDITTAPDGAMEFMTSSSSNYALLVNVFSGRDKPDMEVVIGNTTSKNWISNVLFREKVTLNSKMSIIGFVKDNKYIVYSGRYGNKRSSHSVNANPVLRRGMANFWTMRKLFDELAVRYDIEPVTIKNDKGKNVIKEYDYDLSYVNFTYDKANELFFGK